MSTKRLASLADLPEFADASGDPPKSEITLMRLGKFRHPKFGRWNITRQVFDKLVSNFGAQGRAPIDFDHSADRGGSTEAAGWITGLRIDGNELKGSVEWTPPGANAIKNKTYLYISPTWAWDARNERDEKIGPRLIGAGLTNRPFFSSFPALNLSSRPASAEAFASVDGPLQPDAPCPCSFCRDERGGDVVSADDQACFEAHWAVASARGIKASNRDIYEHVFWRHRDIHGDPLGDEKIAEIGMANQVTLWDKMDRALQPRPPFATAADEPTATVAFAEPEGLDEEGRVLHAHVIAYAMEHEIQDYVTALGALTGAGLPDRQEELPIDIPDLEAVAMRELDKRARALAARENVSYVDAGFLLELDDAIAEAIAEDGRSDTAWLDTSRDASPRPWDSADFERDRRRARSLDDAWELTRTEWEASADAGRDIVFEEALARRAKRMADLRSQRERALSDAQEREARRRRDAINGELDRRARNRLGNG